MSSVPLIGYLNKSNPMSMIYAVLSFAIAHVVISIPTWFIARHLKRKEVIEKVEEFQQGKFAMTDISHTLE